MLRNLICSIYLKSKRRGFQIGHQYSVKISTLKDKKKLKKLSLQDCRYLFGYALVLASAKDR